MTLTLDDFKKLKSLNGDVGTAAGFNRILTGGIFTPDMLKVKDYEFIDWTPAFPNENINKYNIVLGYKATITPETLNSIAIGNNAIATGDNTIQLGWHSHKVTTFDGIYRRADKRDMVDISDVSDGLALIDALKPIKFKYNYRDKVIEDLYPYPHPINEPVEPNIDNFNLPLADGTLYFDEDTYNIAADEYNKLLPYYTDYINKATAVRALREAAYKTMLGSNTNQQVRYGFTTSDVVVGDFNPVLKQLDHNGYDVEYLAFDELLAPMVKAIQEEHKLIKGLRTDTDDQYERLDKLDRGLSDVNNRLDELGVVAGNAKVVVKEASDVADIIKRIEDLEAVGSDSVTLGSDRDDAFRWTGIYLGEDPNIASDARLKKDKRPLEEREKAAALEIKNSIGIYKLIRSIEYKGEDARLHVGVYAQEIVAIMESHGLNPFDYSFIGIDNSDNQHYNIRYGELTLFILAAM